MSYDLFDLTYRVAREIGGGVLFEGKATGGSTTTLIDTNDRDESDNYWQGGTVWVIEDNTGGESSPVGEYSVVSGNTQSSNTITLRETLTADISAGFRYAICKRRYPLHVLIQCVNRALVDLGKVPYSDVSLTVAAEQTEYTLPDAIITQGLRQVWRQTNDDANDRQFAEVMGWDIIKGADGAADTLRLRKQLPDGYSLLLKYIKNHAELRNVGDVLNESVPIERVVYAAAAHALRWYKDKTRLDDFDNTIKRLEDLARLAEIEYPVVLPRTPGKTLMRY